MTRRKYWCCTASAPRHSDIVGNQLILLQKNCTGKISVICSAMHCWPRCRDGSIWLPRSIANSLIGENNYVDRFQIARPLGCRNRRRRNSSLQFQGFRSSPFRFTPPDRDDAVARERNRYRRVARSSARDDSETRSLLGERIRLAQVRGETECSTEFHDRDRRPRHSLHSRPVETRESASAHCYARLARFDH